MMFALIIRGRRIDMGYAQEIVITVGTIFPDCPKHPKLPGSSNVFYA
jgi:hypothetical protein